MQAISNSSAWRLQDAKAQFSALVDSALRGVPQHVTRRGKQAVVVLSEQDFEALQRSAANAANAANAASNTAKPLSLIDHLLAMPKMSKEAAQTIETEAITERTERLEVQPRTIDF